MSDRIVERHEQIEIANLAIDMERKRQVVVKCMESATTLVYADQCPQYRDYAEAHSVFQGRLKELVG